MVGSDSTALAAATKDEIVWLITEPWRGTWNGQTQRGRTRPLLLALTGILPEVGAWQPDGEWGWNLDLWAEPPSLVKEDPMTAVYRIREAAKWSDGTPISADDFQFQWYARSGRAEHCRDCSPPGTLGFEKMASVTGSDGGKTVTVTYKQGANDPVWFGRWDRMYPAHMATRAGIDWRTPDGMSRAMDYLAGHVPDWSGGPYQIESAVVDESVVLVPNPRWYGRREPGMRRISKRVVADEASWLAAAQQGTLHGGWPTAWTAEAWRTLDQTPGLRAEIGAAWDWEHVDVNLTTVPDRALRQAIFSAIDVRHARDAIWGDVAPPLRTNHVFPTHSKYHQDHLSNTGYGIGNVAAAQAILADRGYRGYEEGGVLTDPAGRPVHPLRFAYLASDPLRAKMVGLVARHLRRIGLTVQPHPSEDHLHTLRSRDFDLVVYGWRGTAFFYDAPYQLYHSSSDSNFGGLSNPRVDDLVERIKNQVRLDDSAALANELGPLLMDEAVVLPLWTRPELVFVAERYAGIEPNYWALTNALYNIGAWGQVRSH